MSANARNANYPGKKKGGGFLARQANKGNAKTEKPKPSGPPIAEDDLLKQEYVSPDEVLRLNKVTTSEYDSDGSFNSETPKVSMFQTPKQTNKRLKRQPKK